MPKMTIGERRRWVWLSEGKALKPRKMMRVQ
jgi:hypothetical protein